MSDTTKKSGKGNKVTDNVVYIKGLLKSTYNHADKDDNGNIIKSTNIITIFSDDATIEDKPAMEFFKSFYDGKPSKWIPNWIKEKKDFIAVKSAYNIPVMIEDEQKQMSFAEWVERGNIRGASVTVKCNIKDSAVYPNAMMVHTEGEPYDAFADF